MRRLFERTPPVRSYDYTHERVLLPTSPYDSGFVPLPFLFTHESTHWILPNNQPFNFTDADQKITDLGLSISCFLIKAYPNLPMDDLWPLATHLASCLCQLPLPALPAPPVKRNSSPLSRTISLDATDHNTTKQHAETLSKILSFFLDNATYETTLTVTAMPEGVQIQLSESWRHNITPLWVEHTVFCTHTQQEPTVTCYTHLMLTSRNTDIVHEYWTPILHTLGFTPTVFDLTIHPPQNEWISLIHQHYLALLENVEHAQADWNLLEKILTITAHLTHEAPPKELLYDTILKLISTRDTPVYRDHLRQLLFHLLKLAHLGHTVLSPNQLYQLNLKLTFTQHLLLLSFELGELYDKIAIEDTPLSRRHLEVLISELLRECESLYQCTQDLENNFLNTTRFFHYLHLLTEYTAPDSDTQHYWQLFRKKLLPYVGFQQQLFITEDPYATITSQLFQCLLIAIDYDDHGTQADNATHIIQKTVDRLFSIKADFTITREEIKIIIGLCHENDSMLTKAVQGLGKKNVGSTLANSLQHVLFPSPHAEPKYIHARAVESPKKPIRTYIPTPTIHTRIERQPLRLTDLMSHEKISTLSPLFQGYHYQHNTSLYWNCVLFLKQHNLPDTTAALRLATTICQMAYLPTHMPQLFMPWDPTATYSCELRINIEAPTSLTVVLTEKWEHALTLTHTYYLNNKQGLLHSYAEYDLRCGEYISIIAALLKALRFPIETNDILSHIPQKLESIIHYPSWFTDYDQLLQQNLMTLTVPILLETLWQSLSLSLYASHLLEKLNSFLCSLNGITYMRDFDRTSLLVKTWSTMIATHILNPETLTTKRQFRAHIRTACLRLAVPVNIDPTKLMQQIGGPFAGTMPAKLLSIFQKQHEILRSVFIKNLALRLDHHLYEILEREVFRFSAYRATLAEFSEHHISFLDVTKQIPDYPEIFYVLLTHVHSRANLTQIIHDTQLLNCLLKVLSYQNNYLSEARKRQNYKKSEHVVETLVDILSIDHTMLSLPMQEENYHKALQILHELQAELHAQDSWVVQHLPFLRGRFFGSRLAYALECEGPLPASLPPPNAAFVPDEHLSIMVRNTLVRIGCRYSNQEGVVENSTPLPDTPALSSHTEYRRTHTKSLSVNI